VQGTAAVKRNPASPRRQPRASGTISGGARRALGWRRGLAGPSEAASVLVTCRDKKQQVEPLKRFSGEGRTGRALLSKEPLSEVAGGGASPFFPCPQLSGAGSSGTPPYPVPNRSGRAVRRLPDEGANRGQGGKDRRYLAPRRKTTRSRVTRLASD
jgi:hypothetical protein